MKLLKFRGVMAVALAICAGPLLAAKPSIEDLFRNAEYSNMTLSPNGKYLAAVAPAKGHRNLAIIDLKDRSKSKFITGLNKQDVAGYTWVSNDHIVFGVDADGAEAVAIYAVSREGGKIKTLIDPLGATKKRGPRQRDDSKGTAGLPSPNLLDILEDDPDHILVSYDARKVGSPDVYKVNFKKAKMEMVERNPGTIQGWITDHDGKIRGAVGQNGPTGEIWYRDSEQDEMKIIEEFHYDAAEAFQPLGFDYDNQTWFVSSARDSDTAAIYTYNPKTREFGEQVFRHNDVDVGGLIFSDSKEKVIGVTYFTDKPGWEPFDAEFGKMLKGLEQAFPEKVVNLSSTNKEENMYVVTVSSDTDPGTFYLFDKTAGKLEFLANSRSWIDPEEMSPMRSISYTSRDGLTINGYLTMPKDWDGKTKLPIIINPHGGPWARDLWGFNPEHQFFASRGYAVLQMNFRGSTGYGREFLRASYQQWGKAMQNDVTDGVAWAIEKGYADPERVCIYGGSYGGYATMAGMVFTPDLYQCAVNYVGVTDLHLQYKKMPDRWNLGKQTWYDRVGHPETQAELLAEVSPINHVDKIQAPIFIVHGRKDPRVSIEHATSLRKEMEKHNKDYEWLVKNDEGHGFRKEKNRIELYTALETFFDKHIGSGP